MKIGIEAQRIFRDKPHGMDVFAINLINHLVDLPEVDELVVFVNAPEVKPGVLVEHRKLKVVTFEAQYMVWEQIELAKRIKPYALDVFHFTSNTAALKFPIPVVTTLHDTIFLENNPLFVKGYSPYQRFGNTYRRSVVRRMFKTDMKLVTVSESEANEMMSRYGLKDIGFVHNGVAPFFKREPEEAVKAFLDKHKVHAPYVLFLGNRDPKKNTPNVLKLFAEVAREVADLHFVLLDLAQEELPTLSAEDRAVLEPRLCPLGYINQREIPKVYSGASAFVYCSKRESFGIPVIEAFKCEVPVLASAIPAIEEVSAGGALLVDPLDVASMKDGLLRILKDENLRATLVGKGREVATRYNWSESAKAYIEHYKAVL